MSSSDKKDEDARNPRLSGYSLFNHLQNLPEEPSGFDLFPQINVHKTRTLQSSENVSDSETSCIDDDIPQKTSIHDAINTNRLKKGSSRITDNSTHIREENDIDNSILNKIIDEEESSESGKSNNRKPWFYYRDLYNELKAKESNDGNSLETESIKLTDFEKYNREVAKEDVIRDKLRHLKDKDSKEENVAYLQTLKIGDLDNGYVRPLSTVIEKPRKTYKEGSSTHWYDHFWNRGPIHKIRSTNVRSSSTPIDGEDQVSWSSGAYGAWNTNSSDSTKKPFSNITTQLSAPIDDNDVGIIVGNEEDVDYNCQVVGDEDNGSQEGENAGHSFPRQRSHQTINEPHGFKAFMDRINPIRIMRGQKNHRYQIQRKLKLRHLHQIALGGTLGVGLLLSSGKAFSIAGPLGCLIGFMISGIVVLATMLSFCEMVTMIPLCGGVSGVAARFVDDAFGFAMGVSYWISYMIGMPTEITAASIMLSFYPKLGIPGPSTAGWIAFFLVFATGMNLCDIRIYGEFEYFSTLVKLFFLVVLMIYMVVLNCGGSGPFHKKIGFKYWESSKSDLKNLITFGPFRPTFDVNDEGLGSLTGIGGAKGRLCQIIIATVVAAYAYVGTEIVIIAGSEARNPRRAIPSATRNIYWRILFFYILSIFVVGLNIYSGDPRLLHYFNSGPETNGYKQQESAQQKVIKLIGGDKCRSSLLNWGGFSNGNQSPFVIAIQSAGLCSFAGVTNAFLLYYAVTAATSQLYASSRTLYFMSVQGKAPKIFSICSKRGVPYASVLFTAMFGLLSFLSVKNNTAVVFERMLSVCASTGLIVWSGMCLSFIRFYYGLRLRPDIINRNDENYPYRSPFQPYLAYFGMIAGFIIVILSGFLVFIKGKWSTLHFISSYGSLFVFLICYICYKIFRRTKIHKLDRIDLDSGRREIDRIIWEDEQNYVSNFKEIIQKGIKLLF